MIAYKNEPGASDKLTIKQLKWLLDEHSVEYRYISGEMKIADSFVEGKSHVTEWVSPMKTYGALMSWLGY